VRGLGARIAAQAKAEAKQVKREEVFPTSKVSIEERLRRLHAKSDAAAGQSLPSTTEPAGDSSESPFSFASPHPKKLEVFTSGSDVPSSATPSGGAYSVRVLLNPAEIESPTADELA
jgi:hypothetical protein